MEIDSFKIPYQWQERTVTLQKSRLFLPDHYEHYEEFTLPPWSDDALFGDHRPLCIEYCSGNGEWICNKARAYPQYNWIAVEKWCKRARLIWQRKQRMGLDNLFLVVGAAEILTRYYMQESTVEQIFINFPDPWPKHKHAKHRLMQAPFVAKLERILKPQGQLHFMTDDKPYLDSTLALLLQFSGLKPQHPYPFYLVNNPDYGSSYFQELWRSQGKDHYLLEMVKDVSTRP